MPHSDVMFERKLRAQSAMEYLMTYGWAILIIAVVLGALFSLHVFSSASLLPQACIATSGYTCSGQVLTSATGTLKLTFGQATNVNWGSTSSLCLVPANTTYSGACTSPMVSDAIGALNSGGVVTASFSNAIASSSPLGTSYSGTIWANAIVSGTPEYIQVATITIKST